MFCPANMNQINLEKEYSGDLEVKRIQQKLSIRYFSYNLSDVQRCFIHV